MKRIGLLAASAVLVLLGMSALPTFANDLHQQGPIAWNDPAFAGGADCQGLDLNPGVVLWHFVHTQAKDPSGAVIIAQFTEGPVGTFGYVNGNSIVMYDVTTGETTLQSASDNIVNDGLLNLSHICTGGPLGSPSPSASPSPSDSASPTPSASASPSDRPTPSPSDSASPTPKVRATPPATDTTPEGGSGGVLLLVTGVMVLVTSVIVGRSMFRRA